jgi:hypothetical protein
MNKKVVIAAVLILIVFFFVSCNTYQRCPAYGYVETEVVEDAVS